MNPVDLNLALHTLLYVFLVEKIVLFKVNTLKVVICQPIIELLGEICPKTGENEQWQNDLPFYF